ncbi:hypothetical protein HG66A1_44670 [Gimesia chilikensis]|uniref:Uncharacterized protein n=1 Tax=Gimesia chilikensis TaxID=2605989 RepID=A0A517PTF8_9PLAN|nr:hypothetical protein HG66A1_44670 [Gimesia chilikensis]
MLLRNVCLFSESQLYDANHFFVTSLGQFANLKTGLTRIIVSLNRVIPPYFT